MKTYLDLLPEEKRVAIRRKKRFREIIKQETAFLFPLLILFAMLMSINIILEIENNGIGQLGNLFESGNQTQGLDFYEKTFKEINQKTSDINSFQKKHLYWSGVINSIVELVPQNIYLSDLSTKDFQVFLIGRALEREALIDFQSKITGNGCFENVNVPLSNFVAKNDIDFQMDFSIKKECLISKTQ
ncbi:MAG: hypothetical protein ACD_11C00072G0010 [uncultured bacterium]|nr:MAG: hypothetical protein ACD_11C00072G0010 [uncultured bacterium]HBR71774.1 hypothetical protein [Candidatus Moranbacteria bacterium]